MEFRPMSPEEMQRIMQFLLSQQAKHDARIDQIEENVVQVTQAIAGLTGIVGHVVGHLDRQAEGMVQLTARMDQLTVRIDQLGVRVDQLAEAQRRTDDHLNVLIQMFERHLREDHGARSQGSG